MVGAGAQPLRLRLLRLVGAADGGSENLLDQPRARAAGAGGLGVPAHVLEREQALFLDRAHDRALGNAVAAAHLHGIGHGDRAALALVAGLAQLALAAPD